MKKIFSIGGAVVVILIAALTAINIIADKSLEVIGKNSAYNTDTWNLTMDISSPKSSLQETKDIVLVLEVSDSMDLPPQDGEINVLDAKGNTRWQMLKTAATKFIDNVIISHGSTRAAIVAYGGGDSLKFPWDNHRILSGFTNDPQTLKGAINYPTSQALRQDYFAQGNGIAGNTNLAAGFYGAGSLLPLATGREKSVIVFGGSPPDSGYSPQGKALLGQAGDNSEAAAHSLKASCKNLRIYCFALGDDPLKVFPNCILGDQGYAAGIYSAAQEIILEEAVDSLGRQYYQGLLAVFEPGEGWEPQAVQGSSDVAVDVGGNLIWVGDNVKKGCSLSFSLHAGDSQPLSKPCTAITLIPADAGSVSVVIQPQKGEIKVEGNSLVYIPDIFVQDSDEFAVKAGGQELNIKISYQPLKG